MGTILPDVAAHFRAGLPHRGSGPDNIWQGTVRVMVEFGIVKPARSKLQLHFARAARALAGRYMCVTVSEAFCPNIQPRAHARLTGLTKFGTSSAFRPGDGLGFNFELWSWSEGQKSKVT